MPVLVAVLSLSISSSIAAVASSSSSTNSNSSFADGAPRYWPKFGGTRDVRLLDGDWGYGFIDGWDSGFDSMSASFKPLASMTPKRTNVPSCSDVVAGGAPGFLGPRGVAMYSTTYESPKAAGASVRLQFQSCSFYCRVCLV